VTTTASRRFEIAALVVIALCVLFGGRVLIHVLAGYRIPAAILIGVALVAGFVNARRTYAAAPADARVTITRSVAYLVGGALAFAEILWPAKWLPGSCIAAFEVAIVFDIIIVAARIRERAGSEPAP
jgi:hypothetical protein